MSLARTRLVGIEFEFVHAHPNGLPVCFAAKIIGRDRAAAIASGQTEDQWLASVNTLLAEGVR